MVATQQKVYISYARREDKKYKEYMEELFKDLIFNKTVKDKYVDLDYSSDYINKLIDEDYINEYSLLIVLIGKHTKYKKYVDWEIYAGLKQKAYVIGILLPEIKVDNRRYKYGDIPIRLADNVKSGYSKVYTWEDAIGNFEELLSMMYQNKIELEDNINNSRECMLTSVEEYS